MAHSCFLAHHPGMVLSRPFACFAWVALAAAYGAVLQSVEVDSSAELNPEEVGHKRYRERAGTPAALLRTEARGSAQGGSEEVEAILDRLDADEASHGTELAEKVTKKKKKKARAKKCVGTHLTNCPADGSDPCKAKSAGNCVSVFHSCGEDVLKQCKVDKKGKCASGGTTCYLECSGRELFGDNCESQPKERCNGGFVSDGTSGMSCMISPLEATRCIDAGTCALPQE
ncbi:unnamed protein product [Symbiodinium natans]|uniref:Dickkopf N-terminal cysteine-rich domain-containing protein n=1 Tax=Symbiodinium natans TaxID=878477 RepID=A0A812PQU0_9DINO|nr:unnamed protein product [Symbiodinium natans]